VPLPGIDPKNVSLEVAGNTHDHPRRIQISSGAGDRRQLTSEERELTPA
jgi:hypothetical protein